MVFDSEGYLHLTDFGISRKQSTNNHKNTSGTPGYLAPEIYKKIDHNKTIDFYALGIIIYELALGKVGA